MKRNIAVIGAGQLGSRHLQSLADLNSKEFEVAVFDPSVESLDVAKERYNQVKKDDSPNVSYTSDFSALPKEIFLAIIATGSMVRKKVIEQLIDYARVVNISLEKFLFPKLEDYDIIGSLFFEKGINAYINRPRRTFEFYKEIKDQLKPPFHMEVSGVNWGLGCNSMHFVDLFAYLSDSSDFEIVNNLDDEIQDSKRAGYVEFTGGLILKDSNKNILSLFSFKEGSRNSVITISDGNKKINLHEALSKIYTFERIEGELRYSEKTLEMPRQSERTSKFVQQLLDGNPELTTYEESAKQHVQVLEVFLNHYNLITQQNTDTCPIT